MSAQAIATVFPPRANRWQSDSKRDIRLARRTVVAAIADSGSNQSRSASNSAVVTITSPRSSRPLTARALRCCFRLRRRSDPRGPRSLLQPHQPHRFLIIARRLWDRNVYSCIDGVHRLHRRFSDAGASVLRCTTQRFHRTVKKRRVFSTFRSDVRFFSRQRETRV